MPFGLGFFATAGAGGAAGSFDLLETQVLTGNQTSVEFTNLNTAYGSTYQHLQLRLVSLSNADTWYRLQLNGSTSGYYSHRLIGESGSVSSAAYSSTTTGMQLFGLTGTSSVPGRAIMDFLDPFETSKAKVVRSLTAGPNTVGLISGLWNNTAALTSIKINQTDGWAFTQYSRFSLYGLKAA
jgi:hypothetical protein